MAKRGWILTGVLAVAVGAAAYYGRPYWLPETATAQAPTGQQGPRAVPVEVAPVARQQVAVTIEALGTVIPLASVALKSRLETEIVSVHFEDGAAVKQGDLLFTLDGRTLEAQITQTEGVLARDRAQLEQALRDVRRYTELLAKNAGTALNVENAKTQADMLRGTIKADEAALANLRVQLSYTKIVAPISGRISAANLKVGNFVRPADANPLAVINQIKPVYISFAVTQRHLADLRQALASGARVEALVSGDSEPSLGKLAMIDNAVDATTGMVTVRALMNNDDEALWPGSLVNTVLTFRTEEAVVVPAVAVQTSQRGSFVFVVVDGAAKMQPVTVARTTGGKAVISEGLAGGETVVTDGHLLLAEGTKVTPRPPRVGS